MFNDHFPENLAVYEIMWEKYCTARQATDENATRRMRFACRIPKATDPHSEYVILIAFPVSFYPYLNPIRLVLIVASYTLCSSLTNDIS